MGSRTIPNVYRACKWAMQEYENRKRFFEQRSGLSPDQARDKVLLLASNLEGEFAALQDKIENGDLDVVTPLPEA